MTEDVLIYEIVMLRKIMKKLLPLLGSSLLLSSCGTVNQNIYLSCVDNSTNYIAFYKIDKVGELWNISAYNENTNDYVADQFYVGGWGSGNVVSVDSEYISVKRKDGDMPVSEYSDREIDWNYKINRTTGVADGSIGIARGNEKVMTLGLPQAFCEKSTDQVRVTEKI